MSDALLTTAEVRRLASSLGVVPSKRRGQNFVVDANTIRRIVGTAAITSDDVVLEVGPGLGSLTLGLLGPSRAVVAVEVDDALATALLGTVVAKAPALADRLTVVRGDATRITALPQPCTVLVANLPYNVAVPVLLHMLHQAPTLRRGVVMVQTEVADRLLASPGSRTYGVPSVKLAWYAASRSAGTVNASVFWPVPRVGSSLVAFERRAPLPTTADRADVFALIDAAFAQRRKSLRTTLARAFGGKDAAARALTSVGISPATRGEALSVADFARIAEQLAAT